MSIGTQGDILCRVGSNPEGCRLIRIDLKFCYIFSSRPMASWKKAPSDLFTYFINGFLIKFYVIPHHFNNYR